MQNAADVKDRVPLLHRAQFAHTHTGDLYRGMSFIFLLPAGENWNYISLQSVQSI